MFMQRDYAPNIWLKLMAYIIQVLMSGMNGYVKWH